MNAFYMGVTELGQPVEQVVWEVPISHLMLMMRQEQFHRNPDIITLQDKELITKLKTKKQ